MPAPGGMPSDRRPAGRETTPTGSHGDGGCASMSIECACACVCVCVCMCMCGWGWEGGGGVRQREVRLIGSAQGESVTREGRLACCVCLAVDVLAV